MRILIEVENFGKIKKAEIDISNYAIFVGDNNSGKTYMMQLIYGVQQYFTFPENYNPKYTKDILDGIISCREYIISDNEIKFFCDEINAFLDEKKKELVKKIFGKNIAINKLYIKVIFEKETMVVTNGKQSFYANDNKSFFVDKYSVIYNGIEKSSYYFEEDSVTYEGLLNMLLFSVGIGSNYRLFMPASRTGIQLLYKEFYAQKVDQLVMNGNGFDNDIGLTLPIYDFLRFLQTYKGDESVTNFASILSFIEKNLILGHLQIDKANDIAYIPEGENIKVPLYMASSMINEIAPLVLMFTSGKGYVSLLIDEAETSMHPKKQREMVRLLSRINNEGIRLVVSTHSDTMASYFNLMTLISKQFRKNPKKVIKLLEENGFEEADILNNVDVHFYQFKDGGTYSFVEELNGLDNLGIGVDFELFNDSLDNLYSLAKRIMEE